MCVSLGEVAAKVVHENWRSHGWRAVVTLIVLPSQLAVEFINPELALSEQAGADGEEQGDAKQGGGRRTEIHGRRGGAAGLRAGVCTA